MPEPSANTFHLLRCLEQMRAGNLAARDELLCSFSNRLERLARKMLQRFPKVKRWAETDDVMQNSLMRLLRALEDVQPTSTREFFGLAAEQMRRELLDLARHFYGGEGLGAHHASHGGDSALAPAGPEAVAPDDDPGEMEKWCRFHERVAQLPLEEREVVGLIFYHGWKQQEVADLFEVNVRTVRRWWEAALCKLHRLLKDRQAEEE